MFNLFNLDLGGLHYHNNKSEKSQSRDPVKKINGNGNGWSQEIHGNLQLNATGNRTLLELNGPGALKIVGTETIQG